MIIIYCDHCKKEFHPPVDASTYLQLTNEEGEEYQFCVSCWKDFVKTENISL